MTQEDKMLLIKDLSARLPYAVYVQHTSGFSGTLHDLTAVHLYNEDDIKDIDCGIHFFGDEDWFSVECFKPYLFPLSSMTEEQKKEYNYWKHEVPVCRYEYGDVVEEIELYDSPESFEYLIENHFDYRGLIEKGLAIDATGLNIY